LRASRRWNPFYPAPPRLHKIEETQDLETKGIWRLAERPPPVREECRQTLAEGVIVPVSERKDDAVKTIKATGGNGWVVDDEDVYRALELLALNGVYASPTGAVGVAGALTAKHRGNVVCIVTDSGLKSNLMLEGFKKRITSVPDDAVLKRFMERLG